MTFFLFFFNSLALNATAIKVIKVCPHLIRYERHVFMDPTHGRRQDFCCVGQRRGRANGITI